MSERTIKRAKRKESFTVISNKGLRDNKLSFKAKGILAYAMSLPDDWAFYETELTKHATDGRASLRSGLKELEEQGYLKRERERDEKGQLGKSVWVIADEPMFDFPTLDNPTLEKPTLDNRTLLNTNHTKDLYIPNTNNNSPAKAEPFIPYEKIVSYLNESAGTNYRATSKATQRFIKARFNEGYKLDDFIKVIDTKTKEWLNDRNMNQYLRPQTLFGTKFEAYINQNNQTDKELDLNNLFEEVDQEEQWEALERRRHNAVNE